MLIHKLAPRSNKWLGVAGRGARFSGNTNTVISLRSLLLLLANTRGQVHYEAALFSESSNSAWTFSSMQSTRKVPTSLRDSIRLLLASDFKAVTLKPFQVSLWIWTQKQKGGVFFLSPILEQLFTLFKQTRAFPLSHTEMLNYWE